MWHIDKYKITFRLVINQWTNEILQHIVVFSGLSRADVIDARARYRAAARRLRNTALDTIQQRQMLPTRPDNFYLQYQTVCRAHTCRIVLLLVTDWSLCTVAFQNYLYSFLGWGPESAVGVADRYGVQIRVGKYIFSSMGIGPLSRDKVLGA